jgi:predicted phage terminase large subunit-like protein
MPCKVIMKKALQDDNTMLCDGVLDRQAYDLIVKTMGREIVEANYNQNPIDLVGRLYNLGFQTYKQLPVDDKGQSVVEEICAYIDTADQGDDYLCCIIYAVYRQQCYVLDVYFTKEGMEITEPEVAKRLYQYKVNKAYIESNSGGRGFGRSVERILREKHHWYKTYIDLFTQTRNKKARILSSATWCQNNIKFPIGWEVNYHEFYGDVMGYQKEGKMAHDDAEDCLAGIYDKVGKGALFSFT